MKIAARKCELVSLSLNDLKRFYNNYHLQGKNNLSVIGFGLIYNNDLVAAMSLGRHHRNQDDLVLDRLCFANGVNVIGGSHRLIKACKEWAVNQGRDRIISWSDNRWSDGDIYPKLGFELEQEIPKDYFYVSRYNCTIQYSKQSQKKTNVNCPETMTELEWALQRGLRRVADLGKKRWVLQIKG